jgi:hypothetical protein
MHGEDDQIVVKDSAKKSPGLINGAKEISGSAARDHGHTSGSSRRLALIKE